ncbi:hypothetical protein pb186bvf_009505 [Paramecium bursaria]
MQSEEGTINIVQAIVEHHKIQQIKQSRQDILDQRRKVLTNTIDYEIEEIIDPDYIIDLMERDREEYDNQEYQQYMQDIQEQEEYDYMIAMMEREKELYDQQAYQYYIQNYHNY